MSHNTQLGTAVGLGDVVVSVDLALSSYPVGAGKLPASCLYVSPDATTSPVPVTGQNPLPVAVAGAVTANVGTTGGLALDATLTGGTQVAQAVGNVAHDAVDAGAPVKVGGKANSTTPAGVGAGDRVDGWYTLLGAAVTTPFVFNATDGATAGAGVNTAGSARVWAAGTYLSNGSSFDAQRANYEVTALASAARTANTNSADLVNYNARGAVVTVDVTAAGTGTLTFTIKYKDSLSGKYVTLLASAALAGVGTTALRVYPGLTAVANADVNAPLPRLFRVEVTGANGSSWTYSVGVNFVN